MRQEAPSSLWILASLNPWDPWLPLFLYCLLAAHLRTTCVNALCGVNCLLPHLPTPKPIPAAPHLRISASSLIWVTNAALVSPLVTAPSPLTPPPLPTPAVPPSSSHSSRRPALTSCVHKLQLPGMYTKHVKDARLLLLLQSTEKQTGLSSPNIY